MIFLFSCTGNTRWAAERIAKALGERVVDVAHELYPKGGVAANKQPYSLADGETIGFCFPTHGWRPAPVMRQFVESRLSFAADPSGHYCWALTTAGDSTGRTMRRLQALLATKGLRAASTFSLIMPESFVGLPLMDVDKPAKERAKVDAARQAIDSLVVPALLRREGGLEEPHAGACPDLKSGLIGYAFEHWIVGDRHFRADAERCVGCGRCAELCPVGNIQGGKRQQPVWLHTGRCVSCFACYHYCPQRAIEYGRRTRGKGQYKGEFRI